MGKKLAIQGHPTRGKEVIELLEMMSGKGSESFHCSDLNRFYYISHECICWDYIGPDEINEYEIFTLEEFFEKYPFKVGDKVVYTKFGDNCDDYPLIIKSMKWTGTTIEYAFDGYVTCLAKDLKMWTGEPDAAISGIYLNSCYYADEVELYLGDYEIEIRDGKTYAVHNKPKYPTTYDECCKNVLELIHWGMTVDVPMHYSPLIINFTKLLICRDTYWKIAGEEMGLSKLWEFENPSRHYVFTIENFGGKIQKNAVTARILNRILVFPTEEMRDVFYENFKDLIESCKELL